MIANLNNSEDFAPAKIPAGNLQSSVLKERNCISPCGFRAFAQLESYTTGRPDTYSLNRYKACDAPLLLPDLKDGVSVATEI